MDLQKVQIPSCAVSLGTACRKTCCAPEQFEKREKKKKQKNTQNKRKQNNNKNHNTAWRNL